MVMVAIFVTPKKQKQLNYLIIEWLKKGRINDGIAKR
jgi:hypothetical protein